MENYIMRDVGVTFQLYEKIKQYNPKYNNRRDYHWVMQKKKRIKQMPDYCLMRWEKKW